MANFVSNDNATSLMNAINSKKDTKPVEITYDEWIALTDEERAGTHYLITDVPAQSGGGHVIENTSGTDMPQEDNLQFVGVYTEDDSTNNRTKVNIVRQMTKTEFNALSSAEKEGFIHITDEPDNPYNSESGSGGHVIQDASGTDMTQRANMQFADSHVSDDSTNGRTVVENVKEVTLAELEQETERGFYLATDEESVPIGEIDEDYVEVTADGVKTYGQLLNELYALIDENRLSKGNSFVEFNNAIFHYMWNQDGNKINFTLSFVTDLHTDLQTIVISSASRYSDSSDGNITDYTNTVATSGTKITLYYGNSSGIVELNTDASHCMMSDGQTVEDACGNYVEYALNDYVNTTNFDTVYPSINKIRVFGNLAIFSISGIMPKVTTSGATVYENLPFKLKGYISVPLTNGTHNSYPPIAVYYHDERTLKIDLQGATAGDKYFGELVTFIERL